MKRIVAILIFCLTLYNLSAQLTWVQCANFPLKRFAPYTFSINNKLYTGGGQDVAGSYFRDLWEYTPSSNTWVQKKSLPLGYERVGVRSFVINGKAYLVSGWNTGTPHELQDVWEYNPATDTFVRKNDLPNTIPGRYTYTAVVIGNKAYLGTGYGILQKDFFSYDPSNDSWTILSDFPGIARQDASFFAINNYCYMGLGNDHITDFTDFYRYNPVNAKWDTLNNFPSQGRSSSGCVVVNNEGYLIGGTAPYTASAPIVGKEVWKYSPSSDSWHQLNNLPDTMFQGLFSNIGNTIFAGLGSTCVNSWDASKINNRVWKTAVSTSLESIGDDNMKMTLMVHSDKTITAIFSEFPDNSSSISIFDFLGKQIAETSVSGKNTEYNFNLSSVAAGDYIVHFSANGKSYSRQFILSK